MLPNISLNRLPQIRHRLIVMNGGVTTRMGNRFRRFGSSMPVLIRERLDQNCTSWPCWFRSLDSCLGFVFLCLLLVSFLFLRFGFGGGFRSSRCNLEWNVHPFEDGALAGIALALTQPDNASVTAWALLLRRS